MRNKVMRSISTFVAGVAVLAVTVVGAGPATAQDGADLNTVDTLFVMGAALGNMEEIQLGLLASQQAVTPQVQQFGQEMAAEHTAAQTQLLGIAQAKGINLPEGLAPGSGEPLPQPEAEQVREFDIAYMAGQVLAHAKALDLHRRAASRAADPDIRAFAAANVPVILRHLLEAQTILQQLRRRNTGGAPTIPFNGIDRP